jgi:hypothetical protein
VAIEATDRGGNARRGGFDRRAAVAVALVGPLIAAAIVGGASRGIDEQRRNTQAARDLTALFAAAYGVLSGTEATQRTLSAALVAGDSGLRFLPRYESAERELRQDRATLTRLAGLVPELTSAARDLQRPLDDAGAAAAQVMQALRARNRDGAIMAGYEFTASITLARDAAQALVDAAHAVIPRRLGVSSSDRPSVAPLWTGGLGALAVMLMMWGVLARPMVRLS